MSDQVLDKGKIKGEVKKDDKDEAKKVAKKNASGKLALNALGPVFQYDLIIKSVGDGILLSYWGYLISLLYQKLQLSAKNVKGSTRIPKDAYPFTPYMVIICGYPILFFVKQIYDNIVLYNSGKRFEVDPYFSICIESAATLKKDLLKQGVVGKVDYKCMQQQQKYNDAQCKMLTDRAYTTVYSVFWLILFFLTSDAGKFKGTIERDNPFIATTIQHALFISLLVISSILFKNYYYMSTYVLDFLTGGLQLLGALMILLITFIIYRIIYFYI